jgi:hypothetical protein
MPEQFLAFRFRNPEAAYCGLFSQEASRFG